MNNFIWNPLTTEFVNIYTNQGNKLLRQYLKSYISQGGAKITCKGSQNKVSGKNLPLDITCDIPGTGNSTEKVKYTFAASPPQPEQQPQQQQPQPQTEQQKINYWIDNKKKIYNCISLLMNKMKNIFVSHTNTKTLDKAYIQFEKYKPEHLTDYNDPTNQLYLFTWLDNILKTNYFHTVSLGSEARITADTDETTIFGNLRKLYTHILELKETPTITTYNTNVLKNINDVKRKIINGLIVQNKKSQYLGWTDKTADAIMRDLLKLPKQSVEGQLTTYDGQFPDLPAPPSGGGKSNISSLLTCI